MVATNSEGRNNTSLFEQSMKMVVNIVKQSSFSIANMSLGVAAPYPATKNLRRPASSSVMVDNETQLRQPPGGQKSEKPEINSKPTLYVMDPSGGNKSSYFVHEDKSHIDGKASAYINKVRRNLSDLSETDNLPLPPPPRAVV